MSLKVGFVLFLVLCVKMTTQLNIKMEWESQDSGVSVNLRGLSVVSPNVAWASGVNGTVVRTKDGGKTWQELPKIKRKVYSLSIKILS